MGLTWHLTDEGGVSRVAHGGATLGQIAMLLLVPEHDLALVILTNAGSGRRLNRDAVRWVLREYLGAVVTDPEPIETGVDELRAYVGAYRRPFMDVELHLDEDERLLATVTQKLGFPERDSPRSPPTTVTLGLSAHDRFIVTEGPVPGARAEIIRNADGSIGWLRFAGRIHARMP